MVKEHGHLNNNI